MMRRLVVAVIGAMAVCGLAAAQDAAAPAAAPAATPAPAAAPSGPAVKEMKIVCDGKVKSDGEVALVVTPAGGAAKDVRVTLQKGMSKSEVCRDIAKELSVALGSAFDVDHYDDDKVEVEGKDDAKFHLSLGAQSATGITLTLK